MKIRDLVYDLVIEAEISQKRREAIQKELNTLREKWGDMAAKAAEIHIRKDYGTNKIPNKKEAQMYSFFGSNSDEKGSSIIG
jgi:hypothetical protein